MESDAVGNASGSNLSPEETQALNSTILEYYKRFGRKRDLEQYFSLNTAKGDIKDRTSLFWRKMKSTDSSDSGEKSRDTSLEVCRIQIKCSAVDIADPTSSQNDNARTKSDSESPPIITEVVEESNPPLPLDTSRHSDDESIRSDDKSVKSDDGNGSQKSTDAFLDTSANKALSPSSSITSQRRLEWDSLADVGYANENEKRTAASSLSTLERLALQQQYSNNDNHGDNLIGPPTAHSTPVEESDMKNKSKKSSKATKIYKKDVDFLEVNIPQNSDANPTQSINVNLTKHISFNVDKGGSVSVEHVQKDYSAAPEKKSVQTEVTPQVTADKEIQTTLDKIKDKSSSSSVERPKSVQYLGQGIPVLINLNNLKKRMRRKNTRPLRKKPQPKKNIEEEKENVPVHEKSGEQVSDAESFEYMPGHIYNQNHLNKDPSRSSQTVGNKSSLESSGGVTTDSSKGLKQTFKKDLEDSVKVLKTALNERYDDKELKKKLIKGIVQKLLNSSYKDDESTTDFLSGLSFSSKKLGFGENTTTSTSDTNNTAEKVRLTRPIKSILRVDKFDPSAIASTSQSAPNLPIASNSENPVVSNLGKVLTTSNSSSEMSKEKSSSDTAKTSSEELYLKYLDALRREEAYKRHLREKEQFIKQKLVSNELSQRRSNVNHNVILPGPSSRLDLESRMKLKALMKDLTRNNYDDGSGDASKLEGGFTSVMRHGDIGNQRNHSVFTLSSSGNSDQNRKSNLKKTEMKDAPKAGGSKEEQNYRCAPNKIGVTDSSVQVNIKRCSGACSTKSESASVGQPCLTNSRNCQPLTHIVSDVNTGEIKYFCLCNMASAGDQSESDNFLIYKCSRLCSQGVNCNVPEMPKPDLRSRSCDVGAAKLSRSSQTVLQQPELNTKPSVCIHEAVRVIQTDITIDPRISNASRSDIRFIDSCECVKLVQEQFRQVSKSSIESDSNVNGEQSSIFNKPCTSNSSANIGTEQNIAQQTSNAKVRSETNIRDQAVYFQGTPEDDGGYVVPIKGTNMTLKVNVCSNPLTDMEIVSCSGLQRPIPASDEGVVTDIVATTENATCLMEECSKGIQSESSNMISDYKQNPQVFNTIFAKPDTKFFNRKPFLRSNTFPDVEQRTSSVRNEILGDIYELDQDAGTDVNTTDYTDYYAKVDTNCGPCYSEKRDEVHLDSGDQRIREIGMDLRRANSLENLLTCTCPYSAESGQVCPIHTDRRNLEIQASCPCPETALDKDDVVCKKVFRTTSTETPRGSSCGCPESEKCGGCCGENAACRKSQSKTDCVVTSEKTPCPCPETAKCENLCLDDAVCRKVLRTTSTETPPLRSPRESSCSCPDSKKCGGRCGKNAACRKSQSKTDCVVPGEKTPCPCPETAQCENTCADHAVCRKVLRTTSTETPPLRSPRESSCGCPDSKKCGGRCGKNAACRKSLPKTECVVPSEKTQATQKVLRTTSTETFREPSCGCPDSKKCGGRCGKNAACRKINDTAEEKSECVIPNKKAPCPCPETAHCKNMCENDAVCRKVLRTISTETPPLRSPRESSCGCPDSKKCGGRCGKDAACRKIYDTVEENSECAVPNKKAPCPCPETAKCENICTEDAECGKALHTTSAETSLLRSSRESSCGCPDFKKCGGRCGKDSACRKIGDTVEERSLPKIFPSTSQTYPPKSQFSKFVRSPSLPIDPKILRMGSFPEEEEIQLGAGFKPTEEIAGPSQNRMGEGSDHIMDVIKGITHRYSKMDLEKSLKKKCFREIVSLLNYLLDTDESTDSETVKDLKNLIAQTSSSDSNDCAKPREEETCLAKPKPATSRGTCTNDNNTDCLDAKESKYSIKLGDYCVKKPTCDKGIQLSTKKSRLSRCCDESLTSTDPPCTSSDNLTCKVLNKIKKECEKYHRKCCRRHSPKKCPKCSSSTSLSCDPCKRVVLQCRPISIHCDQCQQVHQCQCRSQNRCKCKYRPKSACERLKKNWIAYNLILQASDSMISGERENDKGCRPLKNIVVKVPSKKPFTCNVPIKEVECEINDGKPSRISPRSEGRSHRSRSLPSDSGSDASKTIYTVKEYLERNRPDFIEQSGRRQKCLKMISEARANNREAQRRLLSMQVQVEPSLKDLSESDLRRLAQELGLNLRQRKEPPKLISEREMKKHSERIYRRLPEVVEKKEIIKKENIKKTNLLMASIFKKNLQKKTLRGSVNLSNYSTVIKF